MRATTTPPGRARVDHSSGSPSGLASAPANVHPNRYRTHSSRARNATRVLLRSRNPERPGRMVEVEGGALEQLVGDQAGARVASSVAFVVGAGENAGGDVDGVGAHHHHEGQLGIAGGRLASSPARKKRWAVHAATV